MLIRSGNSFLITRSDLLNELALSRRTEKTIWLVELESQLVEHDGYSQVGNKIPVDIPKGTVFYRRVKNWKNSSDEFQEFAYQRNWGIIEPWDGLAKYYNCLD